MKQDKMMTYLRGLLQPLLAIVLGLIVGAVMIIAVGGSVLETYAEMAKGAFGSSYFTASTLARATPIILVGLGASLAFRAGFFNLGAEGQMILGALSAALAALYVPGPAALKLVCALVAGMLAGGLWSALAGWLDTRFRMNLLITTLLFNYIAALFAGYLVSFPLKDKASTGASQTAMLDKSLWLPKIMSGTTLHIGFLVAVLAAIGMAWYLRYTVKGYEIRMLGSNPLFAGYGGVRRGRVMLLSMLASGALAGLAGTFEVLGTQYRYIDNMLSAPGFAWSGIMATLIAGSNPIGTVFAAILLAALQTGGMGVERNTEVPLEISNIIQAALILFVSARLTFAFISRRKARRGADGNAA
ncbi:ABC transporter permease [Paenibacillus aurantius]|uniref:ABC transporter permease n=1 Tax=Paenibacillus aurantius TaxID=2918900 RepID=A0AA96LE13_9BACL|nr:ABC transporter permease [Paenibacillus aurantius]WNQ11976.1 ABC transporter permease [Paenibacillus aurantius]